MLIFKILATGWLKSGTKWHLDAFYCSENYGKRFLVSINIIIDTKIELVSQAQAFQFFDLFWPPGGTKVAQNGISPPGKVWKSCMVFQDTP